MVFSNPNDNGMYHYHPQNAYTYSSTPLDPGLKETSGQADFVPTAGPPINTQGQAPMCNMHDTGVPLRNHVLQVRSDTETALHVCHRTKRTAARPAIRKAPAAGKPRAQFMLHIPYNEYLLPQGALINATIADIIVLLPQWFRNPGIVFRFLNNGITAAVHFAILEEHRYLNCDTPEEAERAKDHLSDTYRGVMRKFNPSWRKVEHRAPEGWDPTYLSIHDFVPDAARQTGYVAPPSIPFKDLAIGLKKSPQGLDAGDLTRALNYALHNVKTDQYGRETELMFPDDIHFILGHIGAMEITQGHIDRILVARYAIVVRKADAARRKQAAEARMRQEEEAREMAHQPMSLAQMHLLPTSQQALGQYASYDAPYGDGSMLPQMLQQQVLRVPGFSHQWIGHGNMPPQHMTAFQSRQAEPSQYIISNATHTGYSSPHSNIPPAYSHTFQPARSPSQEAAAAVASPLVSHGAQQATVDFPDIPDIFKWLGDGDDDAERQQQQQGHEWLYPQDWTVEQQMDALVAANQTPDLSSLLALEVEAALDEPAGQGSAGADGVAAEDVEGGEA